MSLYDDIDTDKKSDNVSGWASGIKFLQNHMQPKKAVSQSKPSQAKKSAQLAPVIDLNKSKYSSKDDLYDSSTPIASTPFTIPFSLRTTTVVKESKKKSGKMKIISPYLSDPQWQFDNEYDPVYPNDYEKALKDLRDRRDKEAEEEEIKRRSEENRDDDENNPPLASSSSSKSSSIGGVAIAPPPCYDQDKESGSSGGGNFGLGTGSPTQYGLNAAARIMAKYGYKEGQGLGKKEQGMATALQVEKTSHRIGRIIHEKDDIRQPAVGTVALPGGGNSGTPPIVPLALAQYNDDEEMMEPEMEEDIGGGGGTAVEPQQQQSQPEPLSNPSKVVLLQNMVGAGEVDDDLEPEVKDECNKYGDVVNVTVFQMPDMDGDDAIRIFVEFQRVEAAMKALIDIDGRFFGGRQVRARFYDYEKYTNLELTD